MTANLEMFWIAGGVAALAGLTALLMIVRRDLFPVEASDDLLAGGGRFFLGGALGIGVIAFCIKMMIIFIVSSFPEKTVSPLLVGETQFFAEKSGPVVRPSGKAIVKSWEALPKTPPSPQDNPITEAKIALGKRLFNDTNLSLDRTVSCASCHDLENHGGADGRAVAVGVGGAVGGRNTPTVLNAAYQKRLFWDGRAVSLEKQAAGPILNPIEMAMPSPKAVVARVRTDPFYPESFRRAFGDAGISMKTITQALAAFERTLVTADTPYDRFVAGDETALTPRQKRGMHKFGALGCDDCHAGPNFSGASTVGPQRPYAHLRTDRLPEDQAALLNRDKGRGGASSSLGLWRIPSLRNVALTAPYFHNGSIDNLREAVRIMARAQVNAELLAPDETPEMERLQWDGKRRRFSVSTSKYVTDEDITDIVAFLHALSGRPSSPTKKQSSVAQDTERARRAL